MRAGMQGQPRRGEPGPGAAERAAVQPAQPGRAGPLRGSTPCRWVGDQIAFDALVNELDDVDVLGIDTEFHRERLYFPRLDLVQVAWLGGSALVDPLAVDLSGLASLLDGPRLVVAHAAEQDLEVLDRVCGTVPRRLFDTQVAAGFLGMATPSLSTLTERLLDRRLAKGDRLTDWSRRPLSQAQRDYAVGDVEHLLDLHQVLTRRLGAAGRLDWVTEECQLLLARDRQPPDPEQAWWRVKSARQLRGQSRGVAQSVAAWRERTAMASDRPARTVLGDLALLSIVHRPPLGRSDLARVRGLEGRRLEGTVATELLEAVAVGLAIDGDKLRLPPSDDLDRIQRTVVALAMAWVAQRADELSIDGSLLATRADVCALLAGQSGGRLAIGWRYDHLGRELVRLVAGEAALAMAPNGSLVCEERSYAPVDLQIDGGLGLGAS